VLPQRFAEYAVDVDEDWASFTKPTRRRTSLSAIIGKELHTGARQDVPVFTFDTPLFGPSSAAPLPTSDISVQCGARMGALGLALGLALHDCFCPAYTAANRSQDDLLTSLSTPSASLPTPEASDNDPVGGELVPWDTDGALTCAWLKQPSNDSVSKFSRAVSPISLDATLNDAVQPAPESGFPASASDFGLEMSEGAVSGESEDDRVMPSFVVDKVPPWERGLPTTAADGTRPSSPSSPLKRRRPKKMSLETEFCLASLESVRPKGGRTFERTASLSGIGGSPTPAGSQSPIRLFTGPAAKSADKDKGAQEPSRRPEEKSDSTYMPIWRSIDRPHDAAISAGNGLMCGGGGAFGEPFPHSTNDFGGSSLGLASSSTMGGTLSGPLGSPLAASRSVIASVGTKVGSAATPGSNLPVADRVAALRSSAGRLSKNTSFPDLGVKGTLGLPRTGQPSPTQRRLRRSKSVVAEYISRTLQSGGGDGSGHVSFVTPPVSPACASGSRELAGHDEFGDSIGGPSGGCSPFGRSPLAPSGGMYYEPLPLPGSPHRRRQRPKALSSLSPPGGTV
jgi:hypothetical protein